MYKIQLRNYQKNIINKSLSIKRAGLFIDMGLGKTLCSLCIITDLLKQNKIKKVLIIAPLQVARSTWPSEINKWDFGIDLKYSLVIGSKEERINGIKSIADIYIINRENVKWLYEKGFYKFDCIIVDESSSFKNPFSIRFKHLIKYKSEYLFLLSGTPAPQGPKDLWSQIALIDRGKSLGRKYSDFLNTYFKPQYKKVGMRMVKKYECFGDDAIMDKIDHLCFHLSKDDYLELPPINYIDNCITLTDKLYDTYESINHDSSKTETDIREDLKYLNTEEEIENYFTDKMYLGNLCQFASGFIYDRTSEKINHYHGYKIKYLEEFVENNPNSNILLAYNYVAERDMILKYVKNVELLTYDNINKWNEGRIKILLANPKSASMGLNLQEGGSTIVWYSPTWNLEDYIQFNARLHRSGQTKPVMIHHLIVKGTIEEVIYKALYNKENVQKSILNYLK